MVRRSVDTSDAFSAAVRRFEADRSAAWSDSLSGVAAKMADESEVSGSGRGRTSAWSAVVCRSVDMWYSVFAAVRRFEAARLGGFSAESGTSDKVSGMVRSSLEMQMGAG